MSSEKQTWHDHVRPAMVAARLDPVRIENAAALGTPDVNYLHGWVELKYAADWPKKKVTPLRIDHFTKEQRTFLWRRWRSGGHAHLLLRVAGEFLLFDGVTAAEQVGGLSRERLGQVALCCVPLPLVGVLVNRMAGPR